MKVHISYAEKDHLPWEFLIIDPINSPDLDATGIPSLAHFLSYRQLLQFLQHLPATIIPIFSRGMDKLTEHEILAYCATPYEN